MISSFDTFMKETESQPRLSAIGELEIHNKNCFSLEIDF